MQGTEKISEQSTKRGGGGEKEHDSSFGGERAGVASQGSASVRVLKNECVLFLELFWTRQPGERGEHDHRLRRRGAWLGRVKDAGGGEVGDKAGEAAPRHVLGKGTGFNSGCSEEPLTVKHNLQWGVVWILSGV